MARCSDIDPLTTALRGRRSAARGPARVAGHIEDCPSCHRHVAAERSARTVVRAHADTLIDAAPAHLRGRCAAAGRSGRPAVWGCPCSAGRGWPMALAATLVLAVAAARRSTALVVNPSTGRRGPARPRPPEVLRPVRGAGGLCSPPRCRPPSRRVTASTSRCPRRTQAERPDAGRRAPLPLSGRHGGACPVPGGRRAGVAVCASSGRPAESD